MTASVTVGVVNDTHGGSNFGPIPRNWRKIDGSLASRTETTDYLYDKYEEYVNEFKKPDILFANGDLVDGQNHLDYASEIWATDPLDQVRVAAHLIDMWQAKQVYVIYGSKYHVKIGGISLERLVAERVKAKLCGYRYRDVIAGKITSVAHNIAVSTSSWQYRSTPLAQQLVLDRLENEDKSANVVIRSHAHYFVGVIFSKQLAFVTPGFQGQTPYMVRKMPEVKPKIGTIQIEFPSLNFQYRTADGPMLRMEAP